MIKHFEGWYFKHQKDGDMIAFIPGSAKSGAFVQVIDSEGSWQFDVPDLTVRRNAVIAGNCVFTYNGAVIDLPGIKGELKYGPLTGLKSDIMGPFRFFPMECRHGVISMRHSIDGCLTVNGKQRNFDNGVGYIEKDSGRSFPSRYLWLQCNDFADKSSIMLSIARIPFAGLNFTGCICAILHGEQEYRLATYKAVRILDEGPGHICLVQGKLMLGIDVESHEAGHPLLSPVSGVMSGVIRENNKACVRVRLWENGVKVLDLKSRNAGFEYFS